MSTFVKHDLYWKPHINFESLEWSTHEILFATKKSVCDHDSFTNIEHILYFIGCISY